MTYHNQLEQLCENILREFEDDPTLGWVHYDDDDEPHVVGEELGILLDRLNDLMYAQDYEEQYTHTEREGEGYPTEEEEG